MNRTCLPSPHPPYMSPLHPSVPIFTCLTFTFPSSISLPHPSMCSFHSCLYIISTLFFSVVFFYKPLLFSFLFFTVSSFMLSSVPFRCLPSCPHISVMLALCVCGGGGGQLQGCTVVALSAPQSRPPAPFPLLLYFHIAGPPPLSNP